MHARSLGCEINEVFALKTTGVEMCWAPGLMQ